jgi:hypothetical protein
MQLNKTLNLHNVHCVTGKYVFFIKSFLVTRYLKINFFYIKSEFFASYERTGGNFLEMVRTSSHNDTIQETREKSVVHGVTFPANFFFLTVRIVYGLINKKDCSRILGNEETGTFLIRFSDSSAGSFAIAYVADDMSDRSRKISRAFFDIL